MRGVENTIGVRRQCSQVITAFDSEAPNTVSRDRVPMHVTTFDICTLASPFLRSRHQAGYPRTMPCPTTWGYAPQPPVRQSRLLLSSYFPQNLR